MYWDLIVTKNFFCKLKCWIKRRLGRGRKRQLILTAMGSTSSVCRVCHFSSGGDEFDPHSSLLFPIGWTCVSIIDSAEISHGLPSLCTAVQIIVNINIRTSQRGAYNERWETMIHSFTLQSKSLKHTTKLDNPDQTHLNECFCHAPKRFMLSCSSFVGEAKKGR